jgi:hypothetical protein
VDGRHAGTEVAQRRLFATICIAELLLFRDNGAYSILRHRGVPIGKRDFLGPVNWL